MLEVYIYIYPVYTKENLETLFEIFLNAQLYLTILLLLNTFIYVVSQLLESIRKADGL